MTLSENCPKKEQKYIIEILVCQAVLTHQNLQKATRMESRIKIPLKRMGSFKKKFFVICIDPVCQMDNVLEWNWLETNKQTDKQTNKQKRTK